jgi:hypothetical protein
MPLLRSHLGVGRLISVTETEVHIGFDPECAEDLRICDQPLNRKAIQNSLRHHLGRAVKAVFERLPPGAARPESSAPPEPPAPDEPPSPPPAAAPGPRPKEAELRRKIIEDPVVRNVLEMFDGSITDIRS